MTTKPNKDPDIAPIRSREETDKSALKSAIENLESVLDESSKHVSISGKSDNNLIGAASIVALASGITLSTSLGGASGDIALDEIARVSSFEIRKVELHGMWWRRSCGAILAFTVIDNDPVALIPGSRNHYDMFDSSGKRIGVVDDLSAKSFDRFAFSFYRGFRSGKVSFIEILKFSLYDCKKDFLSLFIVGGLQAILGLFLPIITGVILDDIIPNGDINYLFQACLVLLVCALATLVFQFVRSLIVIRLNQKMSISLNSALWDRLISLPMPFFRKFTSGDLASRGLDLFVMQEKISTFIVDVIFASIFSIAYALLLIYYNAQLAFLMISVSIIYVVLMALFINKMVIYNRQIYASEGVIAGRILEFFTGIEKIKAMAVENRIFSIWSDLFSKQKKLVLKSGKIVRTTEVFGTAFPVLALAGLFLFLASRSATEMTLGRFVGFINAFYFFQTILLQITTSIFASIDIKPTYDRIRPILESAPEYDQTKVSPDELGGDLEVRGLNFRYDEAGPLVLKDISFHVKPGGFIAVVGPSGSGKSTLIRALLGFERADSGGIYYDKQEIASLDMQKVRRRIGVVLQTSKLIPGNLFTNIAGGSNVTVDDVWRSLAVVGLAEDVKAMPMGIFTMVGAGMGNFSGGQRQKILIARAILKKPSIVYLDEATSALDTINEAAIFHGIETIPATKIVVAHRLSTVMKADMIYVMDKGEIVQSGRYDELIAKDGVFLKLARHQLS